MASPIYPRIRSRYVKSATYLLRDEGFLQEIDSAVGEWNSSFPEFRIRERGYPPCQPWQSDSPFFPFPPAFQLALDRMNHRMERAPEVLSEDQELYGPFTWWGHRILLICQRYWPPFLYPPWTGPFKVPTAGFVAGCLISDPSIMDPDEWIPRRGFTPQVVRFDPLDESLRPMARIERLARETVIGQLRAMLAEGKRITEEDLSRVDRAAVARAVSAFESRLQRGPQEPIAMLPIFPGMSSQDYREAWPAVEAELQRPGNPLDELVISAAHLLARQGRSTSEIAGRLSVDRGTIRKWLQAEDPGRRMTLDW